MQSEIFLFSVLFFLPLQVFTRLDMIEQYLFLDIDGVLNTTRYGIYLEDHDMDDADEDDVFPSEYKSHVVLANPTDGITKEAAVKAIELLMI